VHLAARTFDELVVREPIPEYRSGRRPGEVPSLLQAAVAGGLSPDNITLMPGHDEHEAARVAIAKGGKESLVVLFTDDAAAIWNSLTQRQHVEATI
jgi:hypothetical protein